MKKTLSHAIKFLMLFLVAFLASWQARANHILGIDLSYAWQSGSTYQIQLVIYGDCGNSSFSTLPTAVPEICIYNGSSYVTSLDLTLQAPTAGLFTAPVCARDTDSTTCTNLAYTLPGIKKFVYTGTYTFGSTSSDWQIWFNGWLASSYAGRSTLITNITFGGGVSIIALVDTVNNTTYNNAYNTSPVLTIDPTPYYCIDYPDYYNPGMEPYTGDSVYAFLVAGKLGPYPATSDCTPTGSTSPYTGTAWSGVGVTQPITDTTPLSVDSGSYTFVGATGELFFEPNVTQRSLVVYNFENYHNGSMVGTSQREMTVLAQTCSNYPPTAAFTSATNGEIVDSQYFQICENTGTFCISINPTETYTTLPIYVSTEGLPTGSSFTISADSTNHPTCTFCWTSTGVTPGLYHFFVNLSDDNCPIAGQNNIEFYINITPPPSVIGGTISMCVGKTDTLTDSVAGGLWSSRTTSIATIGSTTGIVVGVATGSDVITYSIGSGCQKTTTVFVNPLPGTVSGLNHTCVGLGTTLTDGSIGGAWSSSNVIIGTVGSTSGVVRGLIAGTINITYTLPTGCLITTTYLVNPLPSTISGSLAFCDGQTSTLSDLSLGGTWTSTNVAVGTVGLTSGTVYGVSPGTDIVSYVLGTSCLITTTVTIEPLPTSIFGTPTMCQGGGSTTVADGSGGGTWSSADITVATIGSTTGVVTGVLAGTTTVTYTFSSTGCYTTYGVTVNPAPDPISGVTTICVGSTSDLTDADAGGTWLSTSTSTATVGSGSGVVTGVTSGLTNVIYTLPTGCDTSVSIAVYPNPPTVTGSTTICVGASSTLTDGTTGGTWVSSNTSVALASLYLGTITGAGAGTALITYTLSTGCYTTIGVTVYSTPAPISGADPLCVGSTTTYTDLTSGGTWSSSYTTCASVVGSTGVVSAGAVGTAIMTYTLGASCRVTKVVTVQASPAAIGGLTTLCSGATVSLTEGTGGGTWSSEVTSVGTVGTSGVVTGVSAGTTVISYKISDGCAKTDTLTVYAAPTAITGTPLACLGATSTLDDAVTGGTWSGGGTIASVGTGTGVVTGLATGTTIITYWSGSCYATRSFTVAPLPSTITGTLSVCAGTSTTLSDASGGGTWISGNIAVATIGSGSGIVAALLQGTVIITYQLPTGCYITNTVNVSSAPSPIIGSGSLCSGTNITLTDGIIDGTWTSSNTSVATIGSTSGTLNGVSGGSSLITYSLGGSCVVTKEVTVYATPVTPGGASALCAGTTTTLSDGVTGGTWISVSTAIATIGSSSGVVNGLTLGTTVITYTAPGGCWITTTIAVSSSPGPIGGADPICNGDSSYCTDLITGGLWTSTNVSVASIGSTTGLITGVSTGSTIITYSLGTGCLVSRTIAVIASPAAISGSPGVCIGASTGLTDGSGGGVWSSTAIGVGTIGAATGVAGGISSGTAIISYTVASGCAATTVLTVSPTPAAITGLSSLCSGTTITLIETLSGATWTSGDAAVATVSATGVVTGVSAGTAIITTFAPGASCYVTKTVTVFASPTAISGPSAICVGATGSLGDGVGGGTWVSSSTAAATISGSGTLTGIALGTTIVTYTAPGGCFVTSTITVSPTPTGILGVSPVCAGSTLTVTDGVLGGVWLSAGTLVATIGSLSGTITGVTSGSTIISYSLGSGCLVSATVTILAAPAAITGASDLCVGQTATLTDGGGGTWTSGNVAVGTISSSGNLGGVGSGNTIITYMISDGCYVLHSVTVSPLPTAIGGATQVCTGQTAFANDVTGGGTWSSNNTVMATVSLVGGIITGVTAGSDIITYTLPSGCYATEAITVNPTPAAITGVTSVCVGATTDLGDLSGGTWSSSNLAVGTIFTSTGVVTGISSGATIITCTLAAGCYTTTTVTVLESPGPIIGATNMCVGTTINYTDGIGGGTWFSSNTAVASINVSSGLISGITMGTTTITYRLPSNCYVTQVLTVNPTATGILGPTHLCTGLCYSLSDAVTGGTWVATDSAVATINTSTGMICAVTSGSTMITYSLGAGCTAVATIAVSNSPDAITGTLNMCQGASTTLGDLSSPGTWSSASTAVATVGVSGIVAGISGGTTLITYVIADGCFATAEVTVNPIDPVGGTALVCQYSSVTLTDGIAGGTWYTSSATYATIGSATGVVTGVLPGTSSMMYLLPSGCSASMVVTVLPVPDIISGTDNVCIGQTTALSDGTGGGTWHSSTTSVATINTSGLVSGLAAGTTIVSYTIGTGCLETVIITVNPLPTIITGGPSVCQGSSITLGDGVPGGSWSGSDALVASVGTASGVLTGIAVGGTEIITYTLGSGCIVTTTINVNPTPTVIAGSDHLCVGQSTGLTNGLSGGVWSSSNTAVATISTAGIVNALIAGTSIISYTLPTGCQATMVFTAVSLPGPIMGADSICVGVTTAFTDSSAGGSWASSNNSVASIDSTTGAATGHSSGTVLISYMIGTGCMEISAIIVNPLSPVDGPTTVCQGQSINVSDTTEGGVWSSGSTTTATVVFSGDTTGTVTGVTAGIVLISYTLPSGCMATAAITVNPAPLPISGTLSVCQGQITDLTDFTGGGGTWSSSATSVATVATTSGIVTGIVPGTALISYTVLGCPAVATVTVIPLPGAIVGSSGVCIGNSIILTDGTFGGTWLSSNAAVAGIGYTTGVVTSASIGTTTITYTVGSGCFVTTTITVNNNPTPISGFPNFCIGSSYTFADGITGGDWYSSNTSVAGVGVTSGVVTGLSVGTAMITYQLGTGCAQTYVVNIISLPPAITGNIQVCMGATDTLYDVLGGGTWTSSATSVATAGSGYSATTGLVMGVTSGGTVISYSLGAGCTVWVDFTVNPNPLPVTGFNEVCVGLTTTLSDMTGSGGWQSGNTAIATVDPLSGTVTGIESGTVDISYVLSTGCSAYEPVVVFPMPGPVGGDKIICLGSSVTLTDSVHGGDWISINPDIASVGSSSGIAMGDTLGTTTIVYEIGPGCSVSTTVAVVPLPNIYNLTGGGSYCEGGTGVPVGLSGSDGGTNYLLYRGSTATGAYSGTGLSLALGLQTVGGYYTVLAINTTTGCTNTMHGMDTVTVIPSVTPAVSITASGRDTVCAGTSVTYTAVPVSGGSGPTYQWMVNGVNVGVGTSYTYVPANADVIRVTITSNVRCASPDTASDAQTLSVQAMEKPYVNFTARPGDTICQGMAVTLYAAPGWGGATPSFVWTVDHAVLGTGSPFSYIPSNGDTIICIMTSNFPCIDTNVAMSDSLIMLVDTPLIPVVNIVATPGTVVPHNINDTLTAVVANGGLNPTYQWYVNSVPITGATNATYISNNFDTSFEDSVSVVVTSSGICPMSAHNWIYIQINDVGVASVQAAGADFVVLPNPNNGSFYVRGTTGNAADELVTIQVTDLLGQAVYKTGVMAQGGKLDYKVLLPSQVANGMYLLTLQTAAGTEEFHVVVTK